jgi:hypothetical protein
MTDQPTEAVIAGSKGFALALLAPLTERVGTRPRIAADPSQALKLTGGSGLVVVEFQGDGSVDAIRQLLVQASGLSVIAAVPEGHAGAEEALRSLGVESVRWDGRPDEVLAAVSRHLAGLPAGAPAPDPASAPPPVPPAVPAAAPSGVGGLFDDMALDEVPADAEPAPVAAPNASAGGAWPSSVPGATEAADALGLGLQGVFAPAGAPLAVVAEVMAGMSPLEKAVLVGEPQPIDVEPIRRAAVMRVRVAVALSTAPQGPGAAPTDPAAVSALLGEIDGLLSDVNALVAGAPPEVQPSLEQVRNALVKEAIDFSEAAHNALPSEAPVAPTPSGAAALARKAAQTRVVSVASSAEVEIAQAEARRQRSLYVALAVAAVLAGAYHGYGWWAKRPRGGMDVPVVTGAPANSAIIGGPAPVQGQAPVMVFSKDGKPFAPEEMKRLEEMQALAGKTVREISPGVVEIAPAPSGAPPQQAR